MTLEHRRDSNGHLRRAVITECPACGIEVISERDEEGCDFSYHLLRDHDEDDFGDLDAYLARRDDHPLFDEPDVDNEDDAPDEPLAGVST